MGGYLLDFTDLGPHALIQRLCGHNRHVLLPQLHTGAGNQDCFREVAAMKQKRKLKNGTRYQAAPISAVTTTIAPWDMGATGPANRAGLEREDATELDPKTGKPIPNPNRVSRMRRVDMLEVWHRKGVITTAGYNAAVSLRNAFEATQKAPGWPDNDRVQSSPKPDHAVAIMIDRVSAYHAINKLVHPGDAAIVDMCVIQDSSPAYIRDKDGKRPYYGPGHKAGIAHIRAALDRLAKRMGN